MDDPLLADRPDLAAAGDLPAHVRIGSWLEGLIVSRTLKPGDKLPSEVEIANALGVSRMTLRQALSSIEAKGLIDRRRGRFGGNFVATPRIEFDHASLPGFTEQMRRIHVEAGAQVLSATSCRPTADIRQRLGLKRGAQVHEILRARSANGEPIVLEEAYLPAAIFPGLLSANLTGSLYALMRDYNASPFTADEEIEATPATEQQAEILGIEAGSPLLLITRTSFTENGVAVEFSRDYHRADRSRIRIKSRVDAETRPATPAGERVTDKFGR
jgi:GntR family transcriptional regulator